MKMRSTGQEAAKNGIRVKGWLWAAMFWSAERIGVLPKNEGGGRIF